MIFLNLPNLFSESEYAKAFRIFLSSVIKFLRKYDEQSLISYINRSNLLDKYPDIDEFFNTLNKNIIYSSFLSDEIINFFINLLSLNRAKQIYNPCPDNYQLALKINNKLNKQVFTEDSFVTSLPYILNVLYDANLNISFSEPLINPSYKEGYNLQTFDTVVSILPVVRRLHINLNKDIYNRFNFKYVMLSHSLSTYILHLLAQTKNKAYVIIPTIFLSRSFKADIEFRKLLLESSLVSNVILLPVNIFHRATIDCAIIIFDKQKLDKNIRFKVRVYLTETELEKYAIRKYDILLVAKGIKDTISKSGIVINKPEDEIWIAGQSISF